LPYIPPPKTSKSVCCWTFPLAKRSELPAQKQSNVSSVKRNFKNKSLSTTHLKNKKAKIPGVEGEWPPQLREHFLKVKNRIWLCF
jgi:hypothetical protein